MVYVFEGVEKDTLAVYHLVPKNKTVAPIDGSIQVSVPIERIATSSTTHVPFFKLLGGLDNLIACAYLQHIMDSTVLEYIEDGRIVEISDGTKIDKELLLSASADLVLGFPFGNAMAEIGMDDRVPVIGVTEYLEPHPLGRAEWLKFFAMLLDKEEQADLLFNGIAARYDSIRSSNMLRSTLSGVFFGSYWQGQWHASGGNSYMANLIKDAGGNYLVGRHQGTENVTLDLEELVVLSGKAHVFGKILYSEEPVVYEDLLGFDERVHSIVEEREMTLFYGNTAESDLFGNALVEPDVLLREMAWMIRSEEEQPTKYFSLFVK